jgi:adenosylcobinamide kinase/adenosylcobinamide-phosphate guanylyltransferase
VKGKLIVYLGGIRSGKSRLAEARFAKELKGRNAKPVYLATVDSRLIKSDRSMQARISEHQGRRPAAWRTVEIGRELAAHAGHGAMLLDGLGLWVALRHEEEPEMLLAETDAFLVSAKKSLAVMVLDECGQGGVSASPSARRFADLNGRVNQRVCAAAGEVWRVDAGLAQRIK